MTGTPLARWRSRERWLGQSQALINGLSITTAAQWLPVARSTVCRWCHRLLALPHHVKSGQFDGIVETDETCLPKSGNVHRGKPRALGSRARARGGRASQRGMSYDIVLVVRHRSGPCVDQIVAALDAAHLMAVLQLVMATAAVLGTDGSAALAKANHAASRYRRPSPLKHGEGRRPFPDLRKFLPVRMMWTRAQPSSSSPLLAAIVSQPLCRPSRSMPIEVTNTPADRSHAVDHRLLEYKPVGRCGAIDGSHRASSPPDAERRMPG